MTAENMLGTLEALTLLTYLSQFTHKVLTQIQSWYLSPRCGTKKYALNSAQITTITHTTKNVDEVCLGG